MQPLIYWALIPIIGTFTIALIVFAFVMYVNWLSSSTALPGPTSHEGSSARLDLSPYSASSFKFSKELGLPPTVESKREDGVECMVCLLGFEDDEVVRRLHRCNHSFHAPCIDMWMYTHSNCPICRTPVERRAGVDDFMSEKESVSTDISIISR